MNIVLLARKRRKVRHWFFPSLVRASLKHILYQYTYFIHKYLTVLSILRLTQDPSIKVWRVDSDVWAAAGRQIPEMSAGSLFLLSLLYIPILTLLYLQFTAVRRLHMCNNSNAYRRSFDSGEKVGRLSGDLVAQMHSSALGALGS